MFGALCRDKSQSTNKYTVRLRTNADHGLVLLQHRSNSVTADYLAIAIHDGHVEVSVNLGKERPHDLLFMRSRVYVADRQWHTVIFDR